MGMTCFLAQHIDGGKEIYLEIGYLSFSKARIR